MKPTVSLGKQYTTNKVYSVDKSYSRLMCPMTLYSPKISDRRKSSP